QACGEDMIEDRPVDAQVDAGDVDRDPGLELELVLRLELVVLAGAAEDDQQQDHDEQVDPADQEQFALGAHRPSSCVRRWMKPRLPRETVTRTSDRSAADRPASRLPRSPTRRIARVTSHRRASVAAASIARALRR